VISWHQSCGILTASLVFAFPLALSLSAHEHSPSAESVPIKEAVGRFIEAFNRHDAHGVAMAFTEDGDFTSVRGATAHGRKDIEAFYAGVFAGRLKAARRTANVTSIRTLAPDVASVDANWEITGATSDDGKEIPVRRGILTLIVKKDKGVWLIAVYHELELTAP
jgi:uncharacterized protein (TIGR02246 family)